MKNKVVQLKDIVRIIGGGTPKKSNKEFYKGNIPWATVRDLNDYYLFDTQYKINKKAVENSSTNIIPKGNIIIATRVGLGKVVFNEIDTAINQDLKGLILTDKIERNYLFYYFLWNAKYIEESGTGATVKGVKLNFIKELKIPLPPLPEQRRIVSKLDALFAEIDASLALIDQNIEQAEALMGSFLDQEFDKAETENIPLKKISNKVQYGYTGKSKEKGEYYYLRITDIQNGKVDYSQAPFSDIPREDVSKYLLEKGDILFARTGATAGKSYLFNDEEDAVFASYLIRVDVKREVLSPEYLKWFFQSDNYWAQIFGNIVGAAQPNFNGTKLKKLIVPVPKMNVQLALAEKFNAMNEEIEQLTQIYIQKRENLEALKSSLLDRAFKGEL